MSDVKTIKKKIFIRGKIETLTGLHIGGTESGISIGGVDISVIRDSITNEPYIPGSSLKGKMRSLLEKLLGQYKWNEKSKSYGPSSSSNEITAKIFGISADDKKIELKASRLIVRDAFLTDESKRKLAEAELELPFTEVKTETSIDRITSKANPRQIERVPKGAEFDFEMILTIYDGDDEKELIEGVLTSMLLLKDDYLGGHGSRGSGKIKFKDVIITEKTKETYENGGNEENYNFNGIEKELLNKLNII